MTTRTRPKRNAASKRYNDDWEQTPLTKSIKTSNQDTKTQDKKVSVKSSSSKNKNKSKITPPTKKNSKQKSDVHAFSSYFESKRETVRYNYHISPVAKVCVGSPLEKPKLKAIRRKRKGDIFDFCSDEEDTSIIPSKKSKVLSTKKTTNPNAHTKKTKSSVDTSHSKQLTTVTKELITETTKSKAPTKSVRSPQQKKSNKQKGDMKKQQVSSQNAPSRYTHFTRSKKSAHIEETVHNELIGEVFIDTMEDEGEDMKNMEANDKAKEVELDESPLGRSLGKHNDSKEVKSFINEVNEVELPAKVESIVDDVKEVKSTCSDSKEVESIIEDSLDDSMEVEVPATESTEAKSLNDDSKEPDSIVDDSKVKSSIDLSVNECPEDNQQEELCADIEAVNEETTREKACRRGDSDTQSHSSQTIIDEEAPVSSCTGSSHGSSIARPSLGGSGFADLSLSETEDNFKRKSFDHHLKVPAGKIPSLSRASTWPKAAVSCVPSLSTNRPPTVVQNVRQAHECLQHGEHIQFKDQVEYLIDGMRPSQLLSLRCLSTLSLAIECLKTDFCRLLRAHGLVYKIMMLLKDSVEYPSLQVAAVTLFFIVSKDNIDGSDLDRPCLELLLGLMKNSYDERDAIEDKLLADVIPRLDGKAQQEYTKIKAKSISVLEKCPLILIKDKDKEDQPIVKGEGEDTEEIFPQHQNPSQTNLLGIKPSNLTVSELVCECFYNITVSQLSYKWIKEEMRILGILDVIANKAIHMMEQIGDHTTSSVLFCKVSRILKLLENVTFMNKDNQTYLTLFDGSLLISGLCRCLINLKDLVICDNDCDSRFLCLDGLLRVLRVLLNFTHDHELGSFRVGEQNNILQSVLQCIFQIPSSFTFEKGFDLLILSLGLLINLVEHSAPNRELFHGASIEVCMNGNKQQKLAVEAVTELFLLNYKKSKETVIDVPTPQNLSQRTPTSSPMKPSFSPNIKKDSPLPLASRLKIHKDIKGYRSPAKLKEPEQDTGEDSGGSEEDIDEPISDSLVFSREDFDTALTQAGQNMEDSIVASYTALLLALLAKNSAEFAVALKNDLPDHNYNVLVSVLKEFITFMSMAGSSSNRSGLDSIGKIVKHIEKLQEQLSV